MKLSQLLALLQFAGIATEQASDIVSSVRNAVAANGDDADNAQLDKIADEYTERIERAKRDAGATS